MIPYTKSNCTDCPKADVIILKRMGACGRTSVQHRVSTNKK